MAQFRKDTHQYLQDNKTLYEVVMLADQYGNLVGPANPSGMAVDAFGRARISEPFTLFDSFHRFQDNGRSATANNAGGTHGFDSNTSSIICTVDTTSGAYVYRETKRVFAYQPGKSLQVMLSFVMNASKTNLRQRVGMFGTQNGTFLEQSDDVYFVKRSSVSGTVVDTRIAQSNWNVDKLDGTGPSHLTLNLENPQILFTDIEWLGVGSMRMGFVIDGKFIHCHSFHHSNKDDAPKGAYMQTACLPLRVEIENTGTTDSSSSFQQICATVISEGGFELSGRKRQASQRPVAADQVVLTTPGTFYPVMSIRLNPDRQDAVAVPREVSVLPINTAKYQYIILAGATINGAVWANAQGSTTVQFNTNTASTMTGGTVLYTGYVTSTVQGGGAINITDSYFHYQLERDSFANTPYTFTLAVTSDTATSNVCGAVLWDEIT